MSSHLMLVPSFACPASCNYCFGPPASGRTMSMETIEAVVDWQNTIGEGEKLEITFHGGEPLVAGIEFYKKALPVLREGLSSREVRFAIQSNLWLLTDAMCELFKEHNVSIGTSLDGPEVINDAQRGAGYYRRTMAGIERARAHGMEPGCICTFTVQSAQHAGEVFDFFLQKGLGFSIHAALHPMGYSCNGWALSPEAYGELLVGMLDRYLENSSRIRITTLDSMCKSISAGQGGICTFGDCLGQYLAVDPKGWIYSCQRFAGMPEFRLGNVHQRSSMNELKASPAWQMFQKRQEQIHEECGACAHFEFCRGGCPYNVLAANGGRFNKTLRDPHCSAYKQVFEYISDRALAEVFSKENMDAVVSQAASRYGLLRKGRLLQIMRGGPHPQDVAKQARKVVSAVALAVSHSPAEALGKLEGAGLVTDPVRAMQSVTALQAHLKSQSQDLVNAYLHVTYGCNLACDHCYAYSSPRETNQVMPVEAVSCLVYEAARAGFGKAVITGGEPLAHPNRNALLDALAELRPQVKPLQIVLRTNLAYSLSPDLSERLLRSIDQIVVSVDGDQASHDARRGANTYLHTVANLHALIFLMPVKEKESGELKKRLVIASTLTAAQMDGPVGDAVRALADELGVGLRFKPVLPIGRAAGKTFTPEYYTSLGDEGEVITHQANPRSTCGLGMNLYIAPDGQCYPCYALMRAQHNLGNVLDEGLAAVLERNHAYRQVTVDSNRQCRHCALRYLCGGSCRAWSSSGDPDAPPTDCAASHERARGLLISSLNVLGVNVGQWQAAGLPLPEYSPIR